MRLLYFIIVLCTFFISLAFTLATESLKSHRPAVIMVPGAFHSGAVFDQVVNALASAGYSYLDIVELKSVGSLATRQDDIEPVVEALTRHINAGRDVVLVGNSYGATVIGEAVRSFPCYDPSTARPRIDGQVLGLIYLNGYIPFTTEVTQPWTHADIRLVSPSWFAFDSNDSSADVPRTVRWDGSLEMFPPQKTFYNLLPKESADYWSKKLTFSSFVALNTTAQYVPYTGDFRVVYMAGNYDNSVPEALWTLYLNQSGAKMKLERLDADHVSMLSKPAEVAGLIRKYAEGQVAW
ncbi:alpha/beta-hydrolase [Massarina eburnea CBS 473.64]|uniref:Alpha/beta-hydrolase n=1 Tax=Massarina eburnea CBS 473.64 TaxID=1395130 RepID=A0A6A6S1W2_9PLEO|nr:alpha/beta-hydrolase [Massarina eburnea CBS 473.64]